MSKKVLWVGSDGFDVRLADHYGKPFWKELRENGTLAEIPCPQGIKSGEVAIASSPRLWSRYYTGVEPHDNGILGFWEKKTEDGEIVKANVGLDWIRKNRCEKLVNYNDLLVPPIWEIALDEGKSVGGCNVWFSYPISDKIKSQLDQNGKWWLTDWQYPREHEQMKEDRYRHPEGATPPDDYEDETGAGARVAILKQRDPVGFYERLLKQDMDRLEYTRKMIDKYGTPDLCMTLLRGVDGCQHQYRKPEDVPDELPNGEENLEKIYGINIDGIEKLWNTGDFDVLVICGDHGTGCTVNEEGVEFHGKDHAWPAYCLIYGKDLPKFEKVDARYEDVTATVLDFLDIDRPDWYRGQSLIQQTKILERLRDLGYF